MRNVLCISVDAHKLAMSRADIDGGQTGASDGFSNVNSSIVRVRSG